MRRALASVALLVVAATAGPATSGPPVARGEAATPASVRLVHCTPQAREAAFEGRMWQIAAGQRMSLRFRLLERTGSERFRVVDAPGLGRWRWSRAGVREFGYRQGVRGLAAGAVYRVRVDYRWHAADGRPLKRARRRSAPCRQPTRADRRYHR